MFVEDIQPGVHIKSKYTRTKRIIGETYDPSSNYIQIYRIDKYGHKVYDAIDLNHLLFYWDLDKEVSNERGCRN